MVFFIYKVRFRVFESLAHYNLRLWKMHVRAVKRDKKGCRWKKRSCPFLLLRV
ncbi:Hypothetical protein Minf_0950 [Methylacidiphilum infernorum V4]|uniref:Uncharacterized protein n=1 Tax=Methylacidiphilum infernorum (isolate V4) TaxID=481448 RepID=B3DUK2_METI4|nr:Hypothetical protein Minf_0950 [Methylacidiphilum infernorum V4]